MNVTGIGGTGSIGGAAGSSAVKKTLSTGGDGQKGFAESIKDGIESVSKLQEEANANVKKALSGDETGLAEVMISALKAELSMQLTLQIRNKVIDAYNEISRMQI
ncbi:MAG: flagellar hook-basal body complex protein FliE [Actinobacteria bacterium]|nr:flagellar hook-basal body complex protein FliE [Actinomycetota bacterium]